eukprot:g5175.t1
MSSASSYVVREGSTAGAARKPSHAEVSMRFGADEYSYEETTKARTRTDSYVVRSDEELRADPGRKMSHAQVSALYGSDEYHELRHFHIPSHRTAQEALHTLRARAYAGAVAVGKVQHLLTNAFNYVAYLAWFAVLNVYGADTYASPDSHASLGALWSFAAILFMVMYGILYIALGMYQFRCMRSARAGDDEREQREAELERQMFGKCLSLFSKAGMFVATYALADALEASLPDPASTDGYPSLWRWVAAAATTLLLSVLVSVLSAGEQRAEQTVPAGVVITSPNLSSEHMHALARLKTLWLLNDAITSACAWIIALVWGAAIRITFRYRFWDQEDASAPTAPGVLAAAEWALLGVALVIAIAVLIAKRNSLIAGAHAGKDGIEGKDDGHPCAGCLSLLCVLQRPEGGGRQTKAFMKGAIAGALVGAIAGGMVGNMLGGSPIGSGVGAMVGALALAAAGMGLGGTCYAIEQDRASNPVKKGAAAVEMLAQSKIDKMRTAVEGAGGDLARAVMLEGVFDEMANVLSLAQQLVEEASVWLCAIAFYDAVQATLALDTVAELFAQSAMQAWGRMAIIAFALTMLAAAGALVMDLYLAQLAHVMLHDPAAADGEARREIFFYQELSEILNSALGLTVGRSWNAAVLGALFHYGLLDQSHKAPVLAYALLATAFAALMSYQLACDIPEAAEAALRDLPRLETIESMSDEQRAARGVLDSAPSLRKVFEVLGTTQEDMEEASRDAPRTRTTSIGALVGLAVGSVVGAVVGGQREEAHGAAVGAMLGAVLLCALCAGLFAVLAHFLYPEDDDGAGGLIGGGPRSDGEGSVEIVDGEGDARDAFKARDEHHLAAGDRAAI